MTLSPYMVEAIGFTSGTIISLSALPRVLELRRDVAKAAGESISRNVALCVGNLGWVVVGLSTPSLSIAVMCTVASVLNGAVLFVVLRAKHATKTPHG
jgi:hypothetical protein